MNGLLAALGRAGLAAPLVVLAAGVLLPPLAALGHVLLPAFVILLLAMGVCLAEPGRLQRREAAAVLALAACNLLVCPVLVLALLRQTGIDGLGGWLVIVAAAPAAGSAVLMAALLHLPVRPTLLAQLLCFLALPLTTPIVAGLLLEGMVIDPWVLTMRVAVMVGLPTLLGLVLRRLLGEAGRQRRLPALRGVGTLALCGISLAVTHGLASAPAQPAFVPCLLGLTLVSLVGASLGAVVGGLGGAGVPAAFALAGGLRNVSLMWSATQGLASADAMLLMQLGVVWTVAWPAVIGAQSWLPRPSDRALRLATALLALLAVGAVP